MYSNVGATGILIQNKSIASATHSTFQFIFEVVDICRESREKKKSHFNGVIKLGYY